MAGSLIGTEVRRVEDPDLLRGASTFVGNLQVDGLLHLAFVRSPLAHATITSIDAGAALAAPGVVAVYTAHDLRIPRHHIFFALNDTCKRPPLAEGKVRFAGDAVAVVVAESAADAADAVELVDIDYDPLPAVTDSEDALADGAPLQFEELGSNLAAGAREPDGSDPLAGADVVVRARMENQRVAVVPMEGNAIAVVPGPEGAEDELTVHVSTQMPHLLRDLAAGLFELDPQRLRVVSPHVGGGFGGKAGIAPEHTVAIAAARVLDRPVSWVETRSENMVGMPHGRSQVHYVELGLRRDGAIVGLRIRVVGDAGAYAGFGGVLAMGPTRMMAQGVYRVPALGFDVAVALTNTTPIGAFRGAGRPEAAAMLERIMDMGAAAVDMDPAEIRRRNFIRPEQFPFTTEVGTTYDSGDYAAALDEALRLAGYEELRADQARRRQAGERRLLGVGLSTYVEVTGGGGPGAEFGAVTVHDDGTATARVGTSAHGQGHATSFAMLVADSLGIDLDAVRFVQSDTAAIPTGGGTGGSRSLQLGGNAVRAAAGEVLSQARELAASLLEADIDDIVAADGRVGVAGVPDRSFGWAELAAIAERDGSPLAAELDFNQEASTFPFGAHVAVVEVDVDTGHVTPLRHIAVDDCGRVLNPLLVSGQQHGGAAQGIAQALWEQISYDPEGTPLSATLADYAMPSAADLCSFEVASTQTPTLLNPLGAKGIGESATVGSTPAVQNAVVDALSHLGVRHLDLPCTPQRVWRAIRDARSGTTADPWREPPTVFATLPVRGGPPGPEAAGAEI
ncbi:MAG: molybdopterin-dependent oxidoreductase [Pseudonocardiaceae bacterium]|nr:molybdopterin-dependent oxidoreductase [Pseudonocardiaceae bacterium]